MNVDPDTVAKVVTIQHEDIVLAQSCTEPIAIALVAAKAWEMPGKIPEQLRIYVSGPDGQIHRRHENGLHEVSHWVRPCWLPGIFLAVFSSLSYVGFSSVGV